jgi:two-component system, NarL family, sensor kinase
MYKNAQCVLLLVALSMLSGFLQAQNQPLIDSLEKQLRIAKQDTNKVEVLNALAFEYRSVNTEKAYALLEQSVKLSQELKHEAGLGLAYNHIGILYKNKAMFDSAIYFHQKALGIRQGLRDELGMASSYNNLGLTYDTKSDYTNAMDYYIRSLRIREKLNDSSGMSAAYANIARTHAKKGNRPLSKQYFLKALKLREQTADSFWVAQYATALGFSYYEDNNYDTALTYFNRAVRLARSFEDMESVATLLNNIGNLYGETGRVREGVKFHEEALSIQKSMQDSSGIYTSLLSLAQAYGFAGDYTKAVAYSKQAESVLGKIDADPKMMMDYYEVTAELYKKQGDYRRALEAYTTYNIYKDSLIKLENTNIVTEIQAKYESEKKDLEISKKNLALAEADYNIQKRNTIAVGLIVLIIILATLSYLFYNRYKLKKEKELADEIIKQQELRSKAIIDAEEKERIRIAKDLHDGIGQQLSAIKINFSAFKDAFIGKENDGKYMALLNMVDDAVKEVRSVSHDMMPNALLRFGLVAATREFIDKIAMSGSLKVDLQIIGLNERLENTTETVLYRVLQEVVNNIIKHAEASKISIQFIKYEHSLNLILEDNGKGFDTSAMNEFKGIGLKNIISRIEYLNGTVHFDSSHGRGTTVDIDIPIS